MALKIRRSGLVDRKVQHRDARLYIVATEDTYAAEQYLHALQERGLVDRSRVRIVVLSTNDGRSAPGHLIERLDRHKDAMVGKLADDEFWILFDVDHHRDKELSTFVQTAGQKQYGVAGSNPCFEVWLLLHETDDLSNVVTYADDPKAAERCAAELRRVLGGAYNKARIDVSRFTAEVVAQAVARAERTCPGGAWPEAAGTHMYRLMKQLPPG